MVLTKDGFLWIIRINVARNKIDRDAFAGAKLKQIRNPGGLRGGGTANSQVFVNSFQSLRGLSV